MAAGDDTTIKLTIAVDGKDLDKIGKTIKVTFDPDQVKAFTKAVGELRTELSTAATATASIERAMRAMARGTGSSIRQLIQQVKELNSELRTSGGGGGGGGGGGFGFGGGGMPFRSSTFAQASFATLATGGLGAPGAFQQAMWSSGLNMTGSMAGYAGREVAKSSLAKAAAARWSALSLGSKAAVTGTAATGIGLALGAGALAWQGWSRGNQLAASAFMPYQRQRLEAAPFVDTGTLLGDSSGFPTGQPFAYSPGQSLGMMAQSSMGMYRGFANNRERQLMFGMARARGIAPGSFGAFVGAAERTGTPASMSAALAGRTATVAGRGLGLRGQAIVDHFQENLGFLQGEAAAGHYVNQNNLLAQQMMLTQGAGVPGYLATGITQDYAKAQQRVGMRGMQDALDVRMMRAFGYTGQGGPEEYARVSLAMQDPGSNPNAMFTYFRDLLQETGTKGTAMGTMAIQRAVLAKGGNISAHQAAQIANNIDNMTPADIKRMGEQIGGWDGSGIVQDARRTSNQFGNLQRQAAIEGQEIGTGAAFAKNMLDLRQAGDRLAGAAENLLPAIEKLTEALNFTAGVLSGDEAPVASPVPVTPTNPTGTLVGPSTGGVNAIYPAIPRGGMR